MKPVTNYNRMISEIEHFQLVSSVRELSKDFLDEETLANVKYAKLDVDGEYDDEGGTRYKVRSIKFLDSNKIVMFSTNQYQDTYSREQKIELLYNWYSNYEDGYFESLPTSELDDWIHDGVYDSLYSITVDSRTNTTVNLTYELPFKLYYEGEM